jgi:copper(I)-binding protein
VSLRRPSRATGRCVAAVALLSLPLASACGAGKNNETDRERATPYVANADAGTIAVRAIRVVPETDSTGYLIAAVVNRGTAPDTLTNATVGGSAVTPNGVSGFTIDPTHSLVFSTPDVSGTDAATLEITASPAPLTVGTTVPVTFTFENAGTVRVDAPIKSPEQVGSTATAAPIATTGSYPTPSESAATEEP